MLSSGCINMKACAALGLYCSSPHMREVAHKKEKDGCTVDLMGYRGA